MRIMLSYPMIRTFEPLVSGAFEFVRICQFTPSIRVRPGAYSVIDSVRTAVHPMSASMLLADLSCFFIDSFRWRIKGWTSINAITVPIMAPVSCVSMPQPSRAHTIATKQPAAKQNVAIMEVSSSMIMSMAAMMSHKSQLDMIMSIAT